jgi:demethylspheroidene O-methyltransferase
MQHWLDPVLAARDRLLTSPDFQRWAAAFPLTRPIAQRRARNVFDLCAGFVYSQILLACVQLRLLERLRSGPSELARLATDAGISQQRMRQLLEAAATLGLTMRRGADRYGLGIHGAAILANPGILRMIEHHSLLYADLSDPVALLKSENANTALRRYWPYVDAANAKALTESEIAGYTNLMSQSQSLVAEEILDAVPLHEYAHILDIGGGEGTFLEVVGKRYPGLQLTLFDLPAVTARATSRLRAAGLHARASIVGGDFLNDELPRGADLATLVRVLHDHSDDSVKKILASVRRTLPDHGMLLVAEPVAETAGAEPMGQAYFGFYLMAMGSGRPRTFSELSALLTQAGFARIRSIRTRLPLQTSLILAKC